MDRREKRVWIWIIASLILVVGVDVWLARQFPPRRLVLDIGQCSTSSFLRVVFDTGTGFREREGIAWPVTCGSMAQHLEFPLPPQPVRAVRIQPLTIEGTVVIVKASLATGLTPSRPSYQGRGEMLPIDLSRVTAVHAIAPLHVRPEDGSLAIRTEAGATEPRCLLPLNEQETEPRQTAGALTAELAPLDLCLLLALYGLAGGLDRRGLRLAEMPEQGGASRPVRSAVVASALVLASGYVFLLMLNLGRVELVPRQEPSWVAVMTYAIMHRWQFGPDIIFTYGPAMPLTLCTYMGKIDTAVFVSRLLYKAWSLGLLVWVGRLLPIGRRVVFGVVVVVSLGVFSEQALWTFSLVATGLLLAREGRPAVWLLAPSLGYVAGVSLIKATFLLYAVLMVGAVVGIHLGRRRWGAAGAIAILFPLCLLTAWKLLGQQLSNLPLYFRGSSEITDGYSQAMSLPPEPLTLFLGLAAALATGAQLVLLCPWRAPQRWTHWPLAGLLASGALLAWKGGFVRADRHVIDWMAYAAVSAVAAPAFFPPVAGARRRGGEWVCLLVILLAGGISVVRLSDDAGAEVAWPLQHVWSVSWRRLLRPTETARIEKRAVLANRRAFALPEVRRAVGAGTVDVFGDEQGIAILNGLNFRPRPCFVNYSTYTPWLVNLDLAYYRSDRAPEYVLFKLRSIDAHPPTLEGAPLLLLLAECYKPLLQEGGYTLLQRRAPPTRAGQPAELTACGQGRLALGETLPLPTGQSLWCELVPHETVVGKLEKIFYQPPPLIMKLHYEGGRIVQYRLVPGMLADGFLINPLPTSGEEFLRWLAVEPLPAARSLEIVSSPGVETAFGHQLEYRLRRVELPRAALAEH